MVCDFFLCFSIFIFLQNTRSSKTFLTPIFRFTGQLSTENPNHGHIRRHHPAKETTAYTMGCSPDFSLWYCVGPAGFDRRQKGRQNRHEHAWTKSINWIQCRIWCLRALRFRWDLFRKDAQGRWHFRVDAKRSTQFVESAIRNYHLFRQWLQQNHRQGFLLGIRSVRCLPGCATSWRWSACRHGG